MRRSAVLPAALAAAASLAAATPAAHAAGDAITPEAGRKAYTSLCARCHGIDLVRTGGAFYDLRRFPADGKARFLKSVNDGLRAMPAWKGIATAEQIEAIWRYVGSVNGWPPEAQQAAGADAAGRPQ